MSNMRNVVCPFCRSLQLKIGSENGKKILACGHSFKFKRSRSAKELDRKYVKTADGGLELRKEV